jgi:hypothetical protein
MEPRNIILRHALFIRATALACPHRDQRSQRRRKQLMSRTLATVRIIGEKFTTARIEIDKIEQELTERTEIEQESRGPLEKSRDWRPDALRFLC